MDYSVCTKIQHSDSSWSLNSQLCNHNCSALAIVLCHSPHFIISCSYFGSFVSLQVVEIAAINEHLLTECENKDKFAKCPRCQEAREKKEMDVHITEKTCPSEYCSHSSDYF